VDDKEEKAKEDGLFCIAWGAGRFHMNCPVVVTHESQVAAKSCGGAREQLGKLPALCQCDCLDCKRAWWDKGRPMRNDDKIVTQDGRVIA